MCFIVSMRLTFVCLLQAAWQKDASLSQFEHLDSGQRQAIASALVERQNDVPMHIEPDLHAPPAHNGPIRQPRPMTEYHDVGIAAAVGEMDGGIVSRELLCVIVPSAKAYWIDAFDMRAPVSRLMAEACTRATAQLDGMLDAYCVGVDGEERLEPRRALSTYNLLAMTAIIIRARDA